MNEKKSSHGGKREGSGNFSKNGNADEKKVKKRNWAFVIYPTKAYLDSIGCEYDGSSGYGSAPENWKEVLKLSGLQIAVSPLHTDTNPDESDKKPHWHVIAVYGSPTTYNNVKHLAQDKLKGTIPISLDQVRGYYRYLTHKDNPEKFQYDEKDIITFNGFNIANFVELTKSEVTAIMMALEDIIEEKHFFEYRSFCRYVRRNCPAEYYEIATSHTMHFGKYVDSFRNILKEKGISVVFVNEAGELVDEEVSEALK